MIYGSLDHLERYKDVHPGVYAGLRWLAETDLNEVELGKVILDGEKLFAVVQEYESTNDYVKPEAHRKYIDIQYAFRGREYLGYAPLEYMEEEVEAHPDNDVWYYRGEVTNLLLEGRRFAVVFPEDVHSPAIAEHEPASIGKCVVKVLVDY